MSRNRDTVLYAEDINNPPHRGGAKLASPMRYGVRTAFQGAATPNHVISVRKRRTLHYSKIGYLIGVA